ncbi:MAG: diguanylate cyclase [gamma proteobacterium symbiont of Phacoides pectinatus]
MEREWNRCKRERRPISLILFDIDFFKAYNDHHGHIIRGRMPETGSPGAERMGQPVR